MPSAEAAAAAQLDDIAAQLGGVTPPQQPTLASAPSGAMLDQVAASLGAPAAPPGWTRKGIVLVNNKTGEKVPVQQWAGAEPGVGKEAPPPDTGIWQAAQGAATRTFGQPLAAAAETARDFAQAHPTIAAILGGPAAAQQLQEVPQGLTADLAAKADAQRQAYLAAHPGAGGAAAEFAIELGTNLLPLATGLPAAARSAAAGFTGVGAAPTLASVGTGGAVAVATGFPLGYVSAYGQPTGERVKAGLLSAATMLPLGLAGGALVLARRAPESADFSPIARALNEARAADQAVRADAMGQTPPSQLYRQAQEQAQARAAASLPQDATPERVQAATQAEMAQVDALWRESTGMAPPGSPEAQATHAALAAPENAPRGQEAPPPAAAGARPGYGSQLAPEDAAATWMGRPPAPPQAPGVAPEGVNPEAGFLRTRSSAPTPAQLTDDFLYDDLRHPYVTRGNRAELEASFQSLADKAAVYSSPADATDPQGFGYDARHMLEGSKRGNPNIPGDTPVALQERLAQNPKTQDAIALWNRWQQEAAGKLEDINAMRTGLRPAGDGTMRDQAGNVYTPVTKGDEYAGGVGYADAQGRIYDRSGVLQETKAPGIGSSEADLPPTSLGQGLPPIPKRANYLTLRFQDDEPWVQPEGPTLQSGKIGPEQERVFPTLADAMAKGKVPVPGTEDLVGAIRASRESYGKALAMRELLGKVENLATKGPGGGPMPLEDGNPALMRGYDPPRGFERADQVKLLTDLVPGKGNLYVHPDLWKNLKPIITGTDVGRLGEAYDAINQTEKQAELMWGVMHPWALAESGVAMDPNPLQGLASAVKAQGQAAGQLLSHIPGLQRLAPTPLTAAERATALRYIDAGGNIHGAPIEGEAQALAKALAGVQRWGEGTQGAAQVLGRPAAWAAQGLSKAHELNSEYLWHELRPRLQIAAFARNEAALKAVHSGQSNWALGVGGFARRNAIRAQSLEQGMRGVANAVGNGFGAQEWRLHRNAITSDPAVRQAMARSFLSPEWNISSAKMFASPFSKNPVESAMGINYHINHGLMFGGMQLLSQATAGHYTWQNGQGGSFDPYKLSHLQWRNPADGKLYETNVGKHYLELAHGLAGRSSKDVPGWSPITDKLAPVPGSLARAYEAGREKGATVRQKESGIAQNLGAPLVPISLRTGWHNQPKGTKLDLGAWLAGLLAPGPTSVIK